jgi:hypothetical protein
MSFKTRALELQHLQDVPGAAYGYMLPCHLWPAVRPGCHCALPDHFAPQPLPTCNSRCTDNARRNDGEVSPRITVKSTTECSRLSRILPTWANSLRLKDHYTSMRVLNERLSYAFLGLLPCPHICYLLTGQHLAHTVGQWSANAN